MDFFEKYIDKNPLACYSYGPSGSGVLQERFSDLWCGEFTPYLGAFVWKEDSSQKVFVNYSDSFLMSNTFSFTFDSASKIWSTYYIHDNCYILNPSGNTLSFSGKCPQIVYKDSVYSKDDMFVFYVRDSGIYYRNQADNFSIENSFYDASKISRLAQVLQEYQFYAFGLNVLAVDEFSNPILLKSYAEPYSSSGVYSCFENYPTGPAATIAYFFGVPMRNIDSYLNTISSQDFSTFPSGKFSSNALSLSSYILDFVFDDFSKYPSGVIYVMDSGANITGFIWR